VAAQQRVRTPSSSKKRKLHDGTCYDGIGAEKRCKGCAAARKLAAVHGVFEGLFAFYAEVAMVKRNQPRKHESNKFHRSKQRQQKSQQK
jgi:hypothetical protein